VVDDVVEEQQQLAAGEPVAPQPRPVVERGGDVLAGDPDREQQRLERVDRRDRLLVGGVPTQLEEQLSVWEPVGDPVCDVDGEGGLADAGHAGHHVDRGGALLVGGGDPGRQLVDLGVAPGERRDAAGQRRQRGRGGGPVRPLLPARVGGGAGVERRSTGEHPGQFPRARGIDLRNNVMARAVRLEEEWNLVHRPTGQDYREKLAGPGRAVAVEKTPQHRGLGLHAAVLVGRRDPVGRGAVLRGRDHDDVVGVLELVDHPQEPVLAEVGVPFVHPHVDAQPAQEGTEPQHHSPVRQGLVRVGHEHPRRRVFTDGAGDGMIFPRRSHESPDSSLRTRRLPCQAGD
jgi:hypothetical protein